MLEAKLVTLLTLSLPGRLDDLPLPLERHMKPTDQITETDALRRFVRLHSHDFRNHFNGIEMEMMLLELTSDSDGLEGIERIRKEVNAMENGLRYLENRFADPERDSVSARDVFNQWQSRYSAIGDESVIWNCKFNNVSVHVDMRMISNTLCEWLTSMKRVTLEKVTGEERENEIWFSVELREASGERGSAVESLPPGFLGLIESNGGRYREAISSEGQVTGGICCFPAVTSDESSLA